MWGFFKFFFFSSYLLGRFSNILETLVFITVNPSCPSSIHCPPSRHIVPSRTVLHSPSFWAMQSNCNIRHMIETSNMWEGLCLLSFLFSRLNTPSSFSLHLHDMACSLTLVVTSSKSAFCLCVSLNSTVQSWKIIKTSFRWVLSMCQIDLHLSPSSLVPARFSQQCAVSGLSGWGSRESVCQPDTSSTWTICARKPQVSAQELWRQGQEQRALLHSSPRGDRMENKWGCLALACGPHYSAPGRSMTNPTTITPTPILFLQTAGADFIRWSRCQFSALLSRLVTAALLQLRGPHPGLPMTTPLARLVGPQKDAYTPTMATRR